jgi:hypothetical protein
LTAPSVGDTDLHHGLVDFTDGRSFFASSWQCSAFPSTRAVKEIWACCCSGAVDVKCTAAEV